MQLKDIFSIKEPQCLFCREDVPFFKNKYNSEIIDYYCKDCEVNITTHRQTICFNLLDLSVIIDFHKKCFYLSNNCIDYSRPFPIPDLNFNNKYKLAKKLKIYLTFS